MSSKAIMYRQAGSNLAEIGTANEIKGMISNSFSGVSWRKEAVADMTGDIGCCKSGNGTLQFGIFTQGGKTLEGLALEVCGRLNASALGAVCEFCDMNGLTLFTDNSFEREVVEGADCGEAESTGILGAFYESESKALACID